MESSTQLFLSSFSLPSHGVCMALPLPSITLPSILMSSEETWQYKVRLLWAEVERKRVFVWLSKPGTMLMLCMTCCLSERHSYNWHSAFPSNLGRESRIQVVKYLSHDLTRQLKYLRLLCVINFSSALWRRWSHEPAQGWINHSSLLIHPY